MRRVAAAAAALLLATSSAASAPVAVNAIELGQWHFNPATRHFYAQVSFLPWNDAEAFAVAVGGHLAIVNDAAEDAWLSATFPAENLWIGLSDAAVEGLFGWVNGDPSSYRQWCPAEPDDWQEVGGEDYAAINGSGGGVTGCWIDADGGAFEGIVEVENRPRGQIGAAPAGVNSFVGNFDLVDGSVVVAHVVASFKEPTVEQLVPGSVAIYWATDAHGDVKESHGQVLEAWFWDAVSPTDGYDQLARVVGVLCDYEEPQHGSCDPFAMAFVRDAAPTGSGAVGFSVPGSTTCCDGAWYSVGKGSFTLSYMTDTPQ